MFTVVLAGTQYLVHPQKLGTIEQTIHPDALIPVTLLSTSEIDGDVEGILRLFKAVDDVYSDEFTSVLVEKTDAKTEGNGRGQYTLAMRASEHDASGSTFDGLPSGPYFLHGPNLYQAWRLYDDELDAFVFGVLPQSVDGSSDEWEALSSLGINAVHKSVAVPSRLYHAGPSARRPLSGLRISVSDASRLKGVPSTMSSRSWTELYDSGAEETSEHARRLIDLGAVIVGKTKSSQFESGREWVDQRAPWNPRGDGYQSSGGSGAGAGAGLSGYGWMQYATALDALDGIREQADIHGLFALRPTKGLIPLGDWHMSPREYDAAALLSRDIGELLLLARALINPTDDEHGPRPKRILCPLDFVPVSLGKDLKLDNDFVEALEKLLGVRAERVSLSAEWLARPPVEADGQTLEQYIGKAQFDTFCYEFYHQYDEFRRACCAQLGHDAYVEATARFQWNIGEKQTREQYEACVKRLEVFRDWFDERIMSTVPDSDSIMVLPFGHGEQRYRDEEAGEPREVVGVTSSLLAPILGTPQVVVPLAQIPYVSKLTGLTEYQPISGSIMGPKRGDTMLVRLVKAALELAKRRRHVEVGRWAFPETDHHTTTSPNVPVSPREGER